MSQITEPLSVDLNGTALLTNPMLNKGTAFSEDERTAFGLHGLLPPRVGTLDEQVTRRLSAARRLGADLDRYVFLRGLQDANETLFYALLTRHLAEMLPLVYTPTVGEGCQEFSHYWHYPRGLFLSYPNRDRLTSIFANPRFDRVEVIVVSDGERILGLGDQGAGGMGIPIGKLSLYTACAGLHPATTLPILLDTGTNNPERIADPLYLGWKHERIRGNEYDDFVEMFVTAVERRWPHVLLQWEDFARGNAGRLLDRYRNRLCTFNDDIQGTAAVAAGTLLSAMRATGRGLRHQKIAIFGAGMAGSGIGRLLLQLLVEEGVPEAEARKHFFAVDQQGLLVEGMNDLQSFQAPFVQTRSAVEGWKLEQPGRIDLFDVIENAKPTVLIGVSAQPGAFNERIVRAMAKHTERPVIFPLSNPISRCEAEPANLAVWSEGRALVGTGSPFPKIVLDGKPFTVDQTNNAYVFPGVGLAVLAVGARHVTDSMFVAAARALGHINEHVPGQSGALLPPVADLRKVAVVIAKAVALQARAEGLCKPFDEGALEGMIDAKMWEPVYRPYRPKPA